MKKTSSFLYDIIFVGGMLLFFFVIGLLIWGELTLPDERNYTDFYLKDYSEGWEIVKADGSRIPAVIPGQFSMDGSGKLILEKKIGNIERTNLYVTFNSARQDIVAYIDDKKVYSFTTKDTRLFGESSPGTLMFVPVNESDSGKHLRIIMEGQNNYSGVVDGMQIGTQMGIVKHFLAKEKWTLGMTAFILYLGFIAFVIGASIKLAYGKTSPLFFSGWCASVAGLWALAESDVRQFIAPNFSLLSYMTYLSLIMLPFAMAFYFDAVQDGRYRPLYMIAAVLDWFCAFIAIILQFTNHTDLSNVLFFAYIGFILTMVIFTVTLVCDFIKQNVKLFWPELVGNIGVLIAGLVQFLTYKSRPITVDRTAILIGIIFLLLMSYLNALINIRNLERDMFAAVQAQESSSAFLTRMSHEMRTPINAILGMNKMILRESKEDNILDYARDVNGAGNYLLGIVNEVLDLAKVNAGQIEIDNEEYVLMDMVREAYAMVRPRATASRLAFEVDMSDVLPSILKGDKERIIQVVTNLLTNAVKYTPEGRIKLSVQGKIHEGKLLLIISVSDTGIGIEEQNIPVLFNSYRRVSDFKNKRIEGTGLGLTITKQLVDLMGGEISVESVYGKGTTFTVMIPQEICSIEPCGTFSMGPNGDRRVADRHEVFDIIGKILIVDDVAINLRVFTMLLSNTDITVDTAISGVEALEKIKRIKYDMIFIDHLMPGMDGIELKTLIAAIPDNPNRTTPLIMQTANAVVGAKEEYERLGFNDYIEKPIKEEELKKLIRKYIK